MSADEDVTAAPAVIMVACGMKPAALLLPAAVDIGRSIAVSGATHEIADERMSRDHAKVRWERGLWTIVDLDSRNGTFVDGERVQGEARRRGDTVLRTGHTVFLLLGDGYGHPAPAGDAVIGPELARSYDQIRRLATGSVLAVEGEPGSGKELAARVFHRAGPRAAGPFITASCAGMPEGVAERLVFGGKRGVVETIGHVQLARGGTLLLDEIAELDPTAQQALLKWLGTERDVGLVVAGKHLRTAVAEGRLRADLADRFGVPVRLPPLRTRRVDIVRLVQREVAPLEAHPKLVETCVLRPWPGNVTELCGAIRVAVETAREDERDVVRLEDLPDGAGMPPGTASGETAVERNQKQLDRAAVADAMQRANGVVTAAARALGIHRTQLYKLLDKHGIAYQEDK